MHCFQKQVDEAAATLRATFSLDAVNHTLSALFAKGLADSGFVVDAASPTGLYIEAISSGFYDRGSQLLPGRYRECAVVSLLASQGDGPNLAIHLFLALMTGISANDTYDLLLLTGVYAGVNRLTSSLKIAHLTFDAVIKAADAGDKTPGEVFARIAKAVNP